MCRILPHYLLTLNWSAHFLDIKKAMMYTSLKTKPLENCSKQPLINFDNLIFSRYSGNSRYTRQDSLLGLFCNGLVAKCIAAFSFPEPAARKRNMQQTPKKYNIIGRYETVVELYDEPQPRHAVAGDIMQGKGGEYFRVYSDGRNLRLYCCTKEVSAMKRLLRTKSMTRVLADVKREEARSRYRKPRELRRLAAGVAR